MENIVSLDKKKKIRYILVGAHDFIAAFFAVIAAYMLRLETVSLGIFTETSIIWGLVFALIAALTYRILGVTQRLWAYSSFGEFFLIALASIIAITSWTIILYLLGKFDDFPRLIPLSVPIILWFTGMFFLLCPRVIYRYYRENRHKLKHLFNHDQDNRSNILVVGRDDRTISFIKVTSQQQSQYKIIGLVDIKGSYLNSIVYNKPVVCDLNNLSDYLVENKNKQKIKELVLATSLRGFGPEKLEKLMGIAVEHDLIFKRIPPIDMLATEEKINPREVRVSDLLNRREIQVDHLLLEAGLKNKKIIVTGGCGSIGSELVLQILQCQPKEVLVLDNSELAIYDLAQKYANIIKIGKLKIRLADVRDQSRIFSIFETFKPDAVFHAAALKHVPIVEENPLEGIKTNLFGTYNAALAALKYKASSFILISTDKAVNATNVMGATKRLAEIAVQCLDRQSQNNPDEYSTHFMVVRFGNVLRSSGSVIPLFEQQIEKGGPVTVTHKDIKRYFMTIHEAVSLVLSASAQKDKLSHRGNIMVLNMGEPVSIMALARKMILFVGRLPDKDIKIQITGLRPGEKLSEELFDKLEEKITTDDENLFEAVCRTIDYNEFMKGVESLEKIVTSNDEQQSIIKLLELVPGYQPATH